MRTSVRSNKSKSLKSCQLSSSFGPGSFEKKLLSQKGPEKTIISNSSKLNVRLLFVFLIDSSINKEFLFTFPYTISLKMIWVL